MGRLSGLPPAKSQMRLQPRADRWIVLLLVGAAAALAGEAWRVGVTVDEPPELYESYLYWRGIGDLDPGDTPPLMRMICGWVPLIMGAPVPSWGGGNSFPNGVEMLRRLGPVRARRLVFASRLVFAAFPLLTIWLVWHWGREMFSPWIALAVAAGVALEPTVMAHGAFIKSDVPAAFGLVLFCWQAERYWRRPGLRTAAGLTVCLLLAVLAKFSMLVLIPVAFFLILWKGPRLRGIALLAVTLYGGLIAAYQFRVRPVYASEAARATELGLRPVQQAVIRIAGLAPWPREFLYSVGHHWKWNVTEGPQAYLLGRRIVGAAPLYYPFAFAVKFPIGLQVLVLAGLAAAALRLAGRQAGLWDALVFLPPLLLFGLAMRSHIHLGLRYVIPALPLLILGAGFALERWDSRPVRLAAAACLLWAAGAFLRNYPHGMSYFNEWVGGPEQGWKYLADSNVDWGQNLPELASFLDQRRIDHVNLYYLGSDIPEHYLAPSRFRLRDAPWYPGSQRETRLQPTPGVYAVSLNFLLGLRFSPAYQDYFWALRSRPHDGLAGHSIFIYHVR
jgi:hypothetical protein